MGKADSTLTVERVRQVLDYDPETGVVTLRIRTSARTPAGTVIGTSNGKGYLVANIDKVAYRIHRLAWLWVHGEWPDGEIDHINGVRDDNRLCNLRVADRTTNTQNMRQAQKNNRSSRLLGAYRKGVRWQAQITANGTAHCLGTFDTAAEAHQCYLGAKRLLHSGNTL